MIKKTKREKVLDESAKLFVEKGFTATSMKDIAQQNNIEAASLYNHIQSKQEILQVLLVGIAEKFREGMLLVEESKVNELEKLREAIKMHIRIATESPAKTYLILQDWKHLEEPIKDDFLKERKAYQTAFRGLIEAGMAAGVIKKGVPEIMLNNILSSLRWVYNQDLYDNISKIDLNTFEEEMLSFVFRGITVKINNI